MTLRSTVRPAKVVVCGMVWHTIRRSEEGLVADDALTGPAIGAALGVRAAGAQPLLMAALPACQSVNALRLVRKLDQSGELLRDRDLPPLRWIAPALVGTKRDWVLEGDPRGWVAQCDPADLQAATLILANANPRAYATLLSGARPSFTAMDIDGRWGPTQLDALKACLPHVQLLTVTRTDLARLPRGLLAGTGIGRRPGTVLLVKDGPAGVTARIDDQERSWPAPPCDREPSTDIGAGDLLLGILGTIIGCSPTPVTHAVAEAAYVRAMPTLSALLTSVNFVAFADSLLGPGYVE